MGRSPIRNAYTAGSPHPDRFRSPTHCWKNGRLYGYHVAQRVLKDDSAADRGIIRRVSVAAIEAAVVEVRVLLRQPEVVVGT
jgi:hypothetical protein